MTLEGFRSLVRSMPRVDEGMHMHHPDFRVKGKIFATACYPDERWGMLNLPLDIQRRLTKSKPQVFVAASGAWGRGGSTLVLLSKVDRVELRPLVEAAWRRAHAKR